MQDFVFYNPTKIIFGKEAMLKIAENILPYGKKVLLIYGKGSIKRAGIYKKVSTQLQSFTVREFSGVEPNPHIETLQKGLKIAREFKPDLILAVGGGSVIDGAKLIAAATYYQGDPWDFLIKDVEPPKYIPLGVVLTLAATGSEMNSGAVITRWQTHEKHFFIRDGLYPKFSILDPQNTFSVPKDQTAYGIIDAFSHVLEQYINLNHDAPLQDRFSEGILMTLIENAPAVLANPSDYTARANLMFCAAMALNNLIGSGVGQDWAAHAIEHELSGIYDIPHGAGLAIITPRWMEVVLDQKRQKLAQYSRRVWGLVGADKQVAPLAIQRTFQFFKSLGIKMSLGEWKISQDQFRKMAKKLEDMRIGEIPLSASQILEILNRSL